MDMKRWLAALAAAVPLALAAQAPTPADTTTAVPAKDAAKKPYEPHKTPLA